MIVEVVKIVIKLGFLLFFFGLGAGAAYLFVEGKSGRNVFSGKPPIKKGVRMTIIVLGGLVFMVWLGFDMPAAVDSWF